VIDHPDGLRPAPPTTDELAANLLATNRLATDELRPATRSHPRPAAGFMAGVTRPKGSMSSTRVNVGQLTAEETEVLRLLAQGCTNREIAAERNVSLRTVESQRARIIDKTGLRTRSELVRFAFSLGLQRSRAS